MLSLVVAALVVPVSAPMLALLWAAHHFPNTEGWRGRLRQVHLLARLLRAPNDPDGPLYRLWDGHLLSNRTRFLNLGYWRVARDIDAAGAAMAEKLGDAAGLGEGDEILDVGFGFADQDLLWMRRHAPRSIDGVNLSATQVEVARARVASEGLSDRVRLVCGSATALPYPARTFDVVLALECAFHFDTREDFFREARRVLRPGGRIALADLVTSGPARRGLGGVLDGVRARMWQMPYENRIDAQEYRTSLERAGFEDVQIEVISDDVFPPLRAAVRSALDRDELRSRIHRVHNNRVSDALYAAFFTHDRPFSPLDYVIVTAMAPGSLARRSVLLEEPTE